MDNIGYDLIAKLFETARSEGEGRTKALKRLVKLLELDFLQQDQEIMLGEILWSKTDENGFPSDLSYYYFSYINLPHPSTVNPKEILRIYINNVEIPIQSFNKEKGYARTNGRIRVLAEIIGLGSTSVNYEWDEESLNSIAGKIIVWWDLDKHYLKQKDSSNSFFSTPIEFKRRFENLIGLYSEVFSPNIHRLSVSNQNELLRILNEFGEYKILDNETFASFYQLIPQNQSLINSKILESLFSKNEDEIIDALKAIIKLAKLKSVKINQMLNIIGEQIRNRSEVGLASYLETMNLFVKNNSTLLTQEILNNLEFGLRYLIEETRITIKDTLEYVNNKISIKVEAAKLTVSLFYYYNLDMQKIPDYIDQWRVLCLDKNEFSEIRRIWIDEID